MGDLADAFHLLHRHLILRLLVVLRLLVLRLLVLVLLLVLLLLVLLLVLLLLLVLRGVAAVRVRILHNLLHELQRFRAPVDGLVLYRERSGDAVQPLWNI